MPLQVSVHLVVPNRVLRVRIDFLVGLRKGVFFPRIIMPDQVLQMLNFYKLEVMFDLLLCFALVHLNLLLELLFGLLIFLNSIIAFHLDHALAF